MAFWKKAVLCILVIELLGNGSGLITFFNIEDWYNDLEKPPGNPPNGSFGPVWALLYGMMGYALALVWHRPAKSTLKRPALSWFAIQFGLNLTWTPVFFGLHRIDIAFFIVASMLIAIAITIIKFHPISRLAAGLLIPYFVWVAFATYLNAGFWVVNR